MVADSRKIGHNDSFVSSSLKDIDFLITDHYADAKALNAIDQKGVTTIKV